jgi:hypothetical protein
MYRFRKGALVVWRGQVVPIVERFDGRDATLYHIQTRKPDRTLVQDLQVTFGQIISEINSYAQFCVGDKVPVGPWDTYVKARWWNCRKGTVIYRLNDIFDEGRPIVKFTQEELVKRVEGFTMRSV